MGLHPQVAMAQRQSGIELLRIVAMSAIVVWHGMIHGWLFKLYPASLCLGPFFAGGVDLFVLVSGFFLIRVRWLSVLRLVSLVAVFALSAVLLAVVAMGLRDGFGGVGETIASLWRFLKGVNYWFVKYYLLLVACSPLINTAVRSLGIGGLRWTIGLLSALEVAVFVIFPDSGYGLYHFFYLYMLGYYVGREPLLSRWGAAGAAALSVGCLIVYSLLIRWGVILDEVNADTFDSGLVTEISRLFPYNNPLLVVAMVLALIAFSRLRLQSAWVNSLATASLGVYLLQDSCLGYQIIYPFYRDMAEDGLGAYVLGLAISLVALWGISYALSRWIYGWFRQSR